ncbi:uncharacterized protein NECHADRAFT_75598 [Fusarium vanettenii 77-13-4]|uniref:Uncharacterized protein n=1 Tax=Fusarium vanettenii (strain ATCC MYA-4622 / CBS 123669 / FGSC 9596 / NRRL 45880 / 77-13-4) TaxID=660122 RepID=C7YJ92_FUSV7|nr:uncharacterized protein NECHADRAFT_75598 [Fusarium vanettenii 77-13-4]EEU48230.1 hypothetical protein NECHADRAFT_75598 [Fusarium vanettenii 77-13-4]
MQHSAHFLILSSLVLLGNAQDLDQTIVGCEAVSCPMDNFDPHCTLTNITFENIGLTRIPDVPESLDYLSIVKGVNISGRGADDFTSVYYLGTPEDVSLNEVQGCAVIFHDPPQDTFDEFGSHDCAEVMGQRCVDAIQQLATNIAEGKSKDLCKALQEDLQKADIDPCDNLTGGGKGIGKISVKDLSKLENIDGSRNSSSDCWPILPKSANLAEMFTEFGGLNASTAYPELNRITPLLTLFVKGNGKDSIVNETVSRLSCIKINTTQNIGPEEGENAASLSRISALAAGGALALFMLML